MTFSLKLTPLAAVGLYFTLANAQVNCSAGSTEFQNGYNASGTYTTPGPRVNDSYPAETWTWTRYISNELETGFNKTELWQTFGLHTSPLQNLSDPSLPYTGCVIAFDGLPASASQNGASDNGSCSTVLGDCAQELISTVNASASALSGTAAGGAYSYTCQQLLGTLATDKTSKCYQMWTESLASQFLPGNFTGPTSPPVCSDPTNPGNSNETNRAFFAWGGGIDSTAPDNFTIYDETIKTPLPLIVATWLKESGIQGEGGNGWADTKLMCVPGNVTEPGSRTLAEATKGGAIRFGLLSGQLGWVVGLSLVLGLVL